MSTAETLRLSEAEYLRRERAATFRSEFYQGEMFAMAGASRDHGLISWNLGRLLGNALENKPCEGYVNDMRVKVSATGLYTYPDVVVVCGQPQLEDAHGDTLLNPTFVIEILSQSTEAYDRGPKATQYRRIASLKEYALVSQSSPQVEVYSRQPGGDWLLHEAIGLESDIRFESIDVSLPLREIYRKVEFPPAESSPNPVCST